MVKVGQFAQAEQGGRRVGHPVKALIPGVSQPDRDGCHKLNAYATASHWLGQRLLNWERAIIGFSSQEREQGNYNYLWKAEVVQCSRPSPHFI